MLIDVTPAATLGRLRRAAPWPVFLVLLGLALAVQSAAALPVRDLPLFSSSSKYIALRSLEIQERVSCVPETRIRGSAFAGEDFKLPTPRLNEELHRAFGFAYGEPASGGLELSRDPIGFKGGMNLYAYAENNPINKRDPMGLDVNGVPADLDLELGFNNTYWEAQHDPNISINVSILNSARPVLQDPTTGQLDRPLVLPDVGLDMLFARNGVPFGLRGGETEVRWGQIGLGVLNADVTLYKGSADLYREMGDAVLTDSDLWDSYRNSLLPNRQLGNLSGKLEDQCPNSEEGKRRLLASKLIHELTHALRSRQYSRSFSPDFNFGGPFVEISVGDEYFPQLNAMQFLLDRQIHGR